MVLSHENRYNLVVAGILAGRQPKVASVYQSYYGLSVSQCLITVQKEIIRYLSSLQLGSISLLSVILNIYISLDTPNDKYMRKLILFGSSVII